MGSHALYARLSEQSGRIFNAANQAFGHFPETKRQIELAGAGMLETGTRNESMQSEPFVLLRLENNGEIEQRTPAEVADSRHIVHKQIEWISLMIESLMDRAPHGS